MDADRAGRIEDLKTHLRKLTNGSANDTVAHNAAIIDLLRAEMRDLGTDFVTVKQCEKDMAELLKKQHLIDHCNEYHHHDAQKSHPINWACVGMAATILSAIYGFVSLALNK